MKFSISTLLGAPILAAAAPSFAQRSMASMPGMGAKAALAAKTGKGVGVIKAIDAKASTLTLQHGPIEAIGWPAMTMTFKATPPALLKGLALGQKIGFDVRVTDAAATVTAVRTKAGN